MSFMRLHPVELHPLLKRYIEKMWIFESSGRVSDEDMKLIVPNGLIKLVVPYRNGLSGKMEGWHHLSKEHSITLIGMTDIPSVVEAEKDLASGTIGVEFNPMGAYRFFRLKFSDFKNQIHPLSSVLGKVAGELEEQLCNVEGTQQKIVLLQRFLITMFLRQESDPVYDFCIRKIEQSKGRITIKELEKTSGYSSRWLNMKFMDKAGISPKNLASIIRFQQYYQALATNREMSFMEKDFYNYYYDQSHFIKEFKRFTGLPPARFESVNNDFGKIFYKE